MSLILEALRKSEAERRRGLPPDVHAELPPAPDSQPRRWPVWAWLVPALVFILVALVWWLRPQTDSAPPRSTATATPPSPSATTATAAKQATATTLPARTPVPSRNGDSPVSIAQAPSPGPPTGSIAATKPARVDTAAPLLRDPDRTPAKPDTSQPPATTNTTTTKAATTTADSGRILSIQDLDPDTRNALPPLKLSMHLWNEMPAQRFVILDGQRLSEGGRIGEASIVRIERDGVLLEWQGRGLRIPVR